MIIAPLDLFEVAAVARAGLAGLAEVHAGYPGSQEVGGAPSAVKSGAPARAIPETEDAVLGFLRACDAYSGKLPKHTYRALAEMACAYGLVEPSVRGVEAAFEHCRARLPDNKYGRLAIFNIEKYLRRHRQGLEMALMWAGQDLGLWLLHEGRADLAIVVLAHLMGANVTEKQKLTESSECQGTSSPQLSV